MADLNVDLIKNNNNCSTTNSYNSTSKSNIQNSIFDEASASTSSVAGEGGDINSLYNEFQSVQDEQGFLGKLWNGFKNLTGLGLGSNDVEDKIEQYENGEITYDEALSSIESFETKQKGITDLAANTISGVVTGAVAIGGTIASGGLGTGGAIAAGAAIGGAVKAGLKTADRATNDVEGDAIDLKQMTKDVLTGAVDGAVNVATAGMFEGITAAGQTVKQAVINGVKAGAISGAASGAAAGAASYTTEAILEDDVEFSVNGLVSSTVQNAAAGAVMGGIMGGVTQGFSQSKINNSNKLVTSNEPYAIESSNDKVYALDESEYRIIDDVDAVTEAKANTSIDSPDIKIKADTAQTNNDIDVNNNNVKTNADTPKITAESAKTVDTPELKTDLETKTPNAKPTADVETPKTNTQEMKTDVETTQAEAKLTPKTPEVKTNDTPEVKTAADTPDTNTIASNNTSDVKMNVEPELQSEIKNSREIQTSIYQDNINIEQLKTAFKNCDIDTDIQINYGTISCTNPELQNAIDTILDEYPNFKSVIFFDDIKAKDSLKMLKSMIENSEFENLTMSNKKILISTTLLKDCSIDNIVENNIYNKVEVPILNIEEKTAAQLSYGEKRSIFDLIQAYNTAKNADNTANLPLLFDEDEIKLFSIISGSEFKNNSNSLEIAEEILQKSNKLLKVAKENAQLVYGTPFDMDVLSKNAKNIDGISVLDFDEIPDGTDMSAYGFPKGTAKEDVCFYVHMINGRSMRADFDNWSSLGRNLDKFSEHLDEFDKMWSKSLISQEHNETFGNYNFGVVTESKASQMIASYSDDTYTGYAKTLSEGYETLLEDTQRSNMPNIIKKALDIDSDEYVELVDYLTANGNIFADKFNNGTVTVGNKQISIETIRLAIKKAQNTLYEIERIPGDYPFNEIVDETCDISAFIIKAQGLDRYAKDKYRNYETDKIKVFFDFIKEKMEQTGKNLPLFII